MLKFQENPIATRFTIWAQTQTPKSLGQTVIRWTNLLFRNVRTLILNIFSVFSILEKIRYCPHFIRPSVDDCTPQGIDRPRSFSTQSIANDPRTWTKEEFFCRASPGPGGVILVKISLYFQVKIGFPIIIQDVRKGYQDQWPGPVISFWEPCKLYRKFFRGS
jgi:hypothetical protein